MSELYRWKFSRSTGGSGGATIVVYAATEDEARQKVEAASDPRPASRLFLLEFEEVRND